MYLNIFISKLSYRNQVDDKIAWELGVEFLSFHLSLLFCMNLKLNQNNQL